MDQTKKVAIAKIRLSKSAAAPMTHALGSLAGGALGAGTGYFSAEGPENSEERKKRALIGAGIGAVGGGLAPFLMRRRVDAPVPTPVSRAPTPIPRAPIKNPASLSGSTGAPDDMFDPAPDLPFRSGSKLLKNSEYRGVPRKYREEIERLFQDHIDNYRGYETLLEGLRRDIPDSEVADAVRRMGGTPDVMAAPVLKAFTDDYVPKAEQLADIAARIARRPEYADVVSKMEDVGANPGEFLSDLARDIARRDAQDAFGKTSSAFGPEVVHFFRDEMQKLSASGSTYKHPEARNPYQRKVQKRFDRLRKELEVSGHEVGTGHKRIRIPKSLMSEDDLRKELGFVPVTIAIPEAGQTRFQSFRHPGHNYHIHDHGSDWTMHEDRHAASTMLTKKWKMERAKRKAGKGKKGGPSKPLTLRDRYNRSILKPAGDFIAGAPHVITEGIPGAYYYVRGQLKDVPGMLERVKSVEPKALTRKLKSWRSYQRPQEQT